MSGKKGKMIWFVGGIFLTCLFAFSLVGRLFGNINKNEKKAENIVIASEVVWEQNTYDVSLQEGYIETSVAVDNIFVNANGLGEQDLSYVANLIETSGGSYYRYELIEGETSLSKGLFTADNIEVTVYVEYGGKTYKVDVQTVKVKDAWTNFY
ncbi:MAG: hypothetical protein IJX88_05295 [Clostridia bacterium]|nr:hypothetical protein [Clostridia bacterium]